MKNPWLTYQWNEAVDFWGEDVDRRLEETEERYEALPRIPDGMTIVHDQKYTLLEALGFEIDGQPIDREDRQHEKLASMFGVTRHSGPLPDHLREMTT